MREFELVITNDAKADLRKYLLYIQRKFNNPQAIRNVRDDFYQTAASLRTRADTIQQPNSEKMSQKGLSLLTQESEKYGPTDGSQYERNP